MERRKDSKGKVLKEGESQRKDGRYQYRYTGIDGKRRTIYGNTLNELRQKEQEEQILLNAKVNIVSSGMTVRALVDKYIDVHKASVKPTTYAQFETFKKKLDNDPFGNIKINDVNVSTAKIWMTSLYNSGLAYGTLNNYKAIIKPAFDMALDDNLIIRNPFDFSLSKIVQNNASEKRPLAPDEYARMVMFARSDDRFGILADEIIILYETGLRISELCGLTFSDIDLEQNIIRVEKQISSVRGNKRFVQSLKTRSSKRVVPISPAAKESILNIVMHRPKVKEEKEVDGYKDFLLITSSGNPMVGGNIQPKLRRLIAAYNVEHQDNPLPEITPHVLRHTFCTKMIMSGMNIKTVQYLMGHSNASVTLNVYSHLFSSSDAVKEFETKLLATGCTPTNRSVMEGLAQKSVTPLSVG